METRKCSICGRQLPLDRFAIDRSRKSGLRNWCRACDRERARNYYEAHRADRQAYDEDRREEKAAYYRKYRAEKLAEERRKKAKANPRKCVRCGKPASSQRHMYCDECFGLPYETRRGRRRKPRGSDPRGSPAERGYGPRHRELRKRFAQIVAAGEAHCARCGALIEPGESWDLGHDDQDRTKYSGPEHSRCNRATSAHRKKRRRAKQSRIW